MGHNLFGRGGRAVVAVLTCLAGALAVGATLPQQPDPLTPPANGPRRGDPTHHALVGATVHVSPTEVVEKATVVIRDGRVVSVGTGAAPVDAQVWEGEGLHVYAAFVEPYLEVDAPQPDRNKAGVHWNAKVTPQRRALEGPGVDAATAKALRGMGFATAAISPRGGIFRGQAAVVSLAEPDSQATESRPPVYADNVYQSVAFEGGGFGGGGGAGDNTRWDGYPQSLMGAIALVRQTLSDVDWMTAQRDESPNALSVLAGSEGLKGQRPRPLMFSVDDELDALRAVKVADEFKRDAVLLGSGMEFRRLDAIAAAKKPVVVPLNYPRKPNVAGIAEAEAVELRELMTWEQAPTNARRLSDAGVTVAFTTAKLRDRGQFRDNLRSAIRHGLKEEAALAALTTTPAQMLGVADQVGTVEAGKRANLIVADGPIFEKKTKIRDMWVDGKRHEITAAPTKLEGTYEVTLDPAPKAPGTIKMVIDKDNNVTIKKVPAEPPAEAGGAQKKDEAPAQVPNDPAAGAKEPAKAETKPEDEVKDAAEPKDDAQPKTKGDADRPLPRAAPTEKGKSRKPKEQTAKAKSVVATTLGLSFVFEHEPFGTPGVFTLSGVVEPRTSPKTITGDGRRADGEPFRWTAVRVGDATPGKADGFAGKYRITMIDGNKLPEQPESELVIPDEKTVTVRGGPDNRTITADDVKVDAGTLSYSVDMSKIGVAGVVVKVTAKREGDLLKGEMTSGDEPNQTVRTFEAVRTGDADDEDETKPDVPEKLAGYPFGAYAMSSVPAQDKIALINATVWTSGPAGVIKNGAVVISEGKIAYVGPSAGLPRLTSEYKTIDCQGKHIAPGIIDCHSHTGISRGVNEGGQAVTAEVRIGDVTTPDSINWYRQLAGGTTAVHSLHGSANPIGGQNQVNKVRWGCVNPDDMHFEGAIPGIKFALGENVKWGNSSGERGGWRYPQTRMGVETLIRDRFTAAREYAAQLKTASMKSWAEAPQPHRDLELEALAEIIEGKRLVHCHSYRQDEILMLARIAEDFGFKLGTYQHILEGYKVADIIRDYSGGASGFADWWAYKVEVQDAIPQAFPIMFEQGAIVSYNSDSDELARRLNVEAGKAVKYSSGSVSAEEALKFVTINPARQLRVDARVGSIEGGKDADIVIWSGVPISALSRCEATYVDGRCLYSLEQDKALREQNQKERQRLIQKVLADKQTRGGGSGDVGAGGPPGARRPGARRPPQDGEDEVSPRGSLISRMQDDASAWRRDHYLDMLRRGINPADVRGGECGCEEWMYR